MTTRLRLESLGTRECPASLRFFADADLGSVVGLGTGRTRSPLNPGDREVVPFKSPAVKFGDNQNPLPQVAEEVATLDVPADPAPTAFEVLTASDAELPTKTEVVTPASDETVSATEEATEADSGAPAPGPFESFDLIITDRTDVFESIDLIITDRTDVFESFDVTVVDYADVGVA